jgi:hypothetical protein
MPAGGTGLEDILLFISAAGLIIVLGGGAFQAWRRWSDNRRIRKHLRQWLVTKQCAAQHPTGKRRPAAFTDYSAAPAGRP